MNAAMSRCSCGCAATTWSLDRRFTDRTAETKTYEDITNDMHLTAATLGLVKPRGDLLGTSNIDRALAEWATKRREERRQLICERVLALPEGTEASTVDAAFDTVCRAYFPEPAHGAACVKKYVWSIKRRLLGLHINQHHMLVLVGPQNCAKSWVGRKLMEPIQEVSAEVALSDALDVRQMDMVQMFSLFFDEMAFADRVECASLKSLISSGACSRRPMGSNRSVKIPVNATLHGNSNKSLGALIYDASGMRRFTEIQVRPRHEIEPNWPLIESFDWRLLWQSVDPYAEDPLEPFADELRAAQEMLRNPSNVEQWLGMFEYDRTRHVCKHDTSSHERVEFYAGELFKLFREWEEDYDPGHRTSLNRWGREFKTLLANKAPVVADWSWRMVGNKVVYSQKLRSNQPARGLMVVGG